MCTNIITISDTITDKRRIYYRQLTKYPSKKVTLELSLSKLQQSHHRLDFYLFNRNFKTKRNYSCQKFGHLRNEDLYIPLGSSGRYRFVTSKEVVTCVVTIAKLQFRISSLETLDFLLELTVTRKTIIITSTKD